MLATRRRKRIIYLLILMTVAVYSANLLFRTTAITPTVPAAIDTHRDAIQADETSERPDRWIVVPMAESDSLIDVDGWTVILYDESDNGNCRYPQCVHLGHWQPQPIIGDSSNFTFSRKLTGYLYAITSGARFICHLETWNDNIQHVLSRVAMQQTTSGLTPVTNATFVEPQTLFTKTTYSTSRHHILVEPWNTYYRYVINEGISPSIQIFTTIDPVMHLDLKQLPPVFLPAGLFTSLDSEVIVFRYDAFWSLVMMDLNFGQYMTQTLLWLLRDNIGVHQSVHLRKSRGFSQHFNATILTQFKKWTCSETLLFRCISGLMHLLSHYGIISRHEIELAKSFFNEMKNIGYFFPRQRTTDIVESESKTYGLIRLTQDDYPDSEIASLALKSKCPKTSLNFNVKAMDDIGLIITFNDENIYRNIPMLEALYRPYFKHIIYCGPNITAFQSGAHTRSVGYFIYIEALKHYISWIYFFECTVEAMKINLGVEGFLQIGDDTLVNPWNIYDLPRQKIWLHTGLRVIPVTEQDYRWAYWKSGRERVVNLLGEMRTATLLKSNDIVQRYLEIFRVNSQNFKNIFVLGCDFMYVPSRFKRDYAEISKLFIDHNIMVEIGFANMAMGLQQRDDIHFVQDGSLWRKNRTEAMARYKTSLIFLHPVKLGTMFEQYPYESNDIICDKYFGRH